MNRQNMRKWLGGLLAGLLIFTAILPVPAVDAAVTGNGIDTQIKKVLSGVDFTVALSQTGKLWAWGNNDFFQLGDGTTIPSLIPVEVSIPDGTVIVDFGVSTSPDNGQRFVVALDEDGYVWHWGQYCCSNNSEWMFDRPEKVKKLNENNIQVDLTDIQAIAVGLSFAYALAEDGRVYSWGYEYAEGELGQKMGSGPYFTKYADFVVNANKEPLQDVIQIAAGNSFGLALTADGTVYAWGSNDKRQLALDESISSRDYAAAIPSLGQVDAIFTSGHSRFAFATSVTGAVYGWGENAQGNLGIPPNANFLEPFFPTVIDDLHADDIRVIRPAGTFTMLLKKDGTLYSSGFSSNQLGDNSTTFVARLYENVGPVDDVFASSFQVYLLSGGSGWALGKNGIDPFIEPKTGLLGTGYHFDKTWLPVRMVELKLHELAVKNVKFPEVSIVKDRLIVKVKDQPFSTHDHVWFGVYRIDDPNELIRAYTKERSNNAEYQFSTNLEPGNYQLAFYTYDSETEEESGKDWYNNSGQGYVIEEGKASLTIQVTSRSDGQPVEGRDIRLERAGTEDDKYGMTDGNGLANFDGLHYGLYRIKLYDEEGTWHDVHQGIYLKDGENRFDVKLVPADEVVSLWPSSIGVEPSGDFSTILNWEAPEAGLDEITEFRIYFVDSEGNIVGSGPIASVPKSGGSYQYQVTNQPVPLQAVALELFAFDGSNERSLGAKAHLWRDWVDYLVQKSHLVDENPLPGQMEWTIHWQAPKNTSGIAAYYLGLDYYPYGPDWSQYEGSYFIAEIPNTGDSQYSFTLKNPEMIEDGMYLDSYITIGTINESGVMSPALQATQLVDDISAEEEMYFTSRESYLDMTDPVQFVKTATEPGTIGGRISGYGPGSSFDVVALDANGEYVGSLLRIYKMGYGKDYFDAVIPPGTPLPSGTAMLGVYARDYDWIGNEPAAVHWVDTDGILGSGIGKLSGQGILYIPEGTMTEEFLNNLQSAPGATASILNAETGMPIKDGDILWVQINANLFMEYTLEMLTTSLKTRLTGFGDRIGLRHILHFVNQIQLDVTKDGDFDQDDLAELLLRIEPIHPHGSYNISP